MVINSFFQSISDFFLDFTNSVPEVYRPLIGLGVYTFFIVIYSFFIWKFYKFIAKRDIIDLNLKQYNRAEHPIVEKLYAVILDTIEYIIILPFLIIFWYSIFAVFLLLLSESQSTAQILLITAAIIAATRVTAYISKDLSKDIAKIFPFTALLLFLLGAETFNIDMFLGRVSQIPSLFTHILIFIIFIFCVEFMLRMVYTLAEFIYSDRLASPAKRGQ